MEVTHRDWCAGDGDNVNLCRSTICNSTGQIFDTNSTKQDYVLITDCWEIYFAINNFIGPYKPASKIS